MVEPSSGIGAIQFQGKDPGEEFQFFFHQHWIRLVRPFSLMMVASLLIVAAASILMNPAVITDATSRRGVLLILSVLFLLLQFQFLAAFYRYFLHLIIVTDKKLHKIKKTLVTHDDHQNIDLLNLQTIDKQQHGIVQNVFGFGTLKLEARETQMRVHFVPHIKKIYEIVMHLHLNQRRQATDERSELLKGMFGTRHENP